MPKSKLKYLLILFFSVLQSFSFRLQRCNYLIHPAMVVLKYWSGYAIDCLIESGADAVDIFLLVVIVVETVLNHG